MAKKTPAKVPAESAAAPASTPAQRQRAADLRSTVAAVRQGHETPSSPRQFTDLAAGDAAALAVAKRVRQKATEPAAIKPVRKR